MAQDEWYGMERPTDPRNNSLFSDPVSLNWILNPSFYQAWQQATNRNSGAGAPGGVGGVPIAGNTSPAVTANAAIEPIPTAGLPSGAGAAGAAAGWGSRMVDALPLIGGLLFGNKGPFSGGQVGGLSGMEPELQQILDLMRQRMEAQGPLFSAVNQGAYNLLPNSAKSGGMFSLPSSTGGR